MEDYAEYPRTVILSTHLIDEVSNLLEHILVIDKGNIIIDQDAEALRGTAFTVTGQAPKVEAFLVEKKRCIANHLEGCFPLLSFVAKTVLIINKR